MIDEEELFNWITGRLQVFFEGSWNHVCTTRFDGLDADVACRQLGYGSGTIVPQIRSATDAVEMNRTNIFPEIDIVGSGCNGNEDRLLDCARASPSSASGQETLHNNFFGRNCLNSEGAGHAIGCVSAPLQGQLVGAPSLPPSPGQQFICT